MRLLHVKNFTLHEYYRDIPPYAILSHTWDDDEVLLADLLSGEGPKKHGWQKLQYCASQALLDGCEYIWVDTCLIDKSFSAELSEVINSMYKWYEDAEICYAYLPDVFCEQAIELSNFWASRWFTRGWTLQELLAPSNVWFFGSGWHYIGSKLDAAMSLTLHNIIDVPINALRHAESLHQFSVKTRMSWAAKRSTTREEDMAYCLMGIFNVNMPLLYGEGQKAFLRLQEQIITIIEDPSIFAWTTMACNIVEDPRAVFDSSDFRNYIYERMETGVGPLAPTPSCFARRADSRDEFQTRPIQSNPEDPVARTSRGLRMPVNLWPVDMVRDIYAAEVARNDLGQSFCIFLRCLAASQSQYTRVFQHEAIIAQIHGALPIWKIIYIIEGSGAVWGREPKPVEIQLQLLSPLSWLGNGRTCRAMIRQNSHLTLFTNEENKAHNRSHFWMCADNTSILKCAATGTNVSFFVRIHYGEAGHLLVAIDSYREDETEDLFDLTTRHNCFSLDFEDITQRPAILETSNGYKDFQIEIIRQLGTYSTLAQLQCRLIEYRPPDAVPNAFDASKIGPKIRHRHHRA